MIPTEEGYYWARIKEKPERITMVEVFKWTDGTFGVWIPGTEYPYPLSLFANWVGPLEPPNRKELK